MQNNRAKQFLPFDALKGFKEALKLIEENTLLEDDIIVKKIKKIKYNELFEITYFLDDMCITTTGRLKIKNIEENYIIIDNSKINFNDIISVKNTDL